MFRKKILALPLVLPLLLSACGAAQPTSDAAKATLQATQVSGMVSATQTAAAPHPVSTETAAPSAAAELNTDYTDAVSIDLQLLVGTLQLDAAGQALTQTQAAALLPLWTEFKEFQPARGGPAQEKPGSQAAQVDSQDQAAALVKQIQAAMTPAQLSAISALEITQQSAEIWMQAQCVTSQSSGESPGEKGDGAQKPPDASQSAAPENGAPPADAAQAGEDARPQNDLPGGSGFIPTAWLEYLITQLEIAAG